MISSFILSLVQLIYYLVAGYTLNDYYFILSLVQLIYYLVAGYTLNDWENVIILLNSPLIFPQTLCYIFFDNLNIIFGVYIYCKYWACEHILLYWRIFGLLDIIVLSNISQIVKKDVKICHSKMYINSIPQYLQWI